jgi:hemerythrin-like domain-containing protein
MVVQIGAKLDSGFDDPLGMLADCHRRIERFLGVLAHVAQHAAEALTPEQATAVQSALDYFRTSGRRHNADEEDSLFPRLRSAGASLAALDHLEHDHRDADALHIQVDRFYAQWIAAGALAPEQRESLRAATIRLERLYADHIATEEKTIFPQAAQLLDRPSIAAIGQEFRARRQ